MARWLLLASLAAAVRAEEPLRARVNVAIDRGVAWLRAHQDEKGRFGRIGGVPYGKKSGKAYDYPAGPTALSLLTLLKCGVPPDDPGIRKGFDYLKSSHRIPTSTYEVCTLILAIEARANPHKRERQREIDLRRSKAKSKRVKLSRSDKKWMKALVKELLRKWNAGGWRYGGPSNPFGIDRDMSHTQFAMMSLFVAWRAGLKIPKAAVRDTIAWVLTQQEQTGPKHARFQPPSKGKTAAAVFDEARGWAYVRKSTHRGDGNVSGSMTSGGIVILLVGRAMLADLDPRTLKRQDPSIEKSIRDGLAWLDLNWTVEENPGNRHYYHTFYLYGLERVGDLRQVHLIGGHDWYAEGAAWLVDDQKDNGCWEHHTTHPPKHVLDTCFALLFLDRATLSVVTQRR